MNNYVIIDEPKPSALSRLAVDPVWPLLGFMFGGAFFSWAWSLFNSHAIGSPTRLREILIVFGGFIYFFAVILGYGMLRGMGILDGVNPGYASLTLMIGELIVCYWLYILQQSTFEIYKHFNGKVVSGIPGVILAFLVGGKFQEQIVRAVMEAMKYVL